MNLHSNYIIMKPIQLPWIYVSPTDLKGLEYHLSPELSIRLDGIISGDQEFFISHVVLGIEGVEVNELQAEQMFLTEFLPNKSKERVNKSFKDGQSSCFFTSKQMEYLQALFEEKNFMSYSVSVYYNDKKVEDIALLPPKEFKMISGAFEELNVQWACDHKANKEEIEAEYARCYEQKVAQLEEHSRKNIWERVQNKGMLKKIVTSVASIALGIGGILARSKLANRGGVGSSLLALLIGTAGVLVEIYGRQEAQNTLRLLKAGDRTERVFS